MNIRFQKEVSIPAGKVTLDGDLFIPSKAKGIVIFSHGSGSSRLSVRNQMVARYLHQRNFGTLLFDLLTQEEDKHYASRFNISLLTRRLVGTTEWLQNFPDAREFRMGYFGASTGAASAINAAALLPQINAVVSRGGRPDLAMDSLPYIETPVLLIVGSLDPEVLALNKQAYIQMECEKKLEVIQGATHLFEETGAMEKVCDLANSWFERYLQPASTIK
jgi:putative phosphoribosyl transferase